jgi:hypothetical protein
MYNFFETYFGFQPTLAEIIWTILLAVIPRAIMWAWKTRPPRGEVWYYLIALPCALIVLSALRFATQETVFAPDVRATIRSIAVLAEGEPSTDPSLAKKGALALMIVHVNNLGTPTIVGSYQVTAEQEGEKFEAYPITLGGPCRGSKVTIASLFRSHRHYLRKRVAPFPRATAWRVCYSCNFRMSHHHLSIGQILDIACVSRMPPRIGTNSARLYQINIRTNPNRTPMLICRSKK